MVPNIKINNKQLSYNNLNSKRKNKKILFERELTNSNTNLDIDE